MGKNFEVLRTCRGSITMATIYVVMLGKTFYEYSQCENTYVCVNMPSNVNIRCHLETFLVLSTIFGDSPRIIS